MGDSAKLHLPIHAAENPNMLLSNNRCGNPIDQLLSDAFPCISRHPRDKERIFDNIPSYYSHYHQ